MKKSTKNPLRFIIPAALIILLILAIYFEKRGVKISIPAGISVGRGFFVSMKEKYISPILMTAALSTS